MLILAGLLTFLYCLLTLWLWMHWQRIPFFSTESGTKSGIRVSVLIPVRNEAANIQQLLEDLDRQCWPDGTTLSPSQLEVIVIDDASDDATLDLVAAFAAHHFSLRLLQLELPTGFTGSHKKLALSQAISQATGEVILTTDGDCLVPAQWVTTMLAFMEQKSLVLVSGPVTFGGEKKLFDHLQTIEFASLIGAGAACMQAGMPNMCNGANLSFRKSAFEEVGGYAGNMHVPSGDDEFLLQKIFQRFPGRVAFLKSRQALVHTNPQPDFLSFYHQRKRWAGKWKLHKKFNTALLAMFIFSFHAILITSAIMTLAGTFPLLYLFCLILVKAAVEWLMLSVVMKNLDKKLRITNFVLLQLIYSAYAVFFGIVANFGGYRWKTRHYSASSKTNHDRSGI